MTLIGSMCFLEVILLLTRLQNVVYITFFVFLCVNISVLICCLYIVRFIVCH